MNKSFYLLIFVLVLSSFSVLGSLTDGLNTYFGFNEGTGTRVYDAYPLLDGNVTCDLTSVVFGVGINGTSINSSSSGSPVAQCSNMPIYKNYTLSAWLKLGFTTDATYFSSVISSNGLYLAEGTGTVNYGHYASGGGQIQGSNNMLNANFSSSRFAMFTITVNSTHIYWYVNGVQVMVKTGTFNPDTTSTDFQFFGSRYGGFGLSTSIDEFGLWNRTLSPSEVLSLNSSFYPFTGNITPINNNNITFSYPTSNGQSFDSYIYVNGSFGNTSINDTYFRLNGGTINRNINTDNSKNSSFCYQESANVSTSCGGLSTGSYTITNPSDWNNVKNTYDGNWATYGKSSTGGIVYVNYTKPVGAINTSKWYISDYYAETNLTIPSSCWNNGNILQLRYGIDTYINWECKNTTAWVSIRTNSGPQQYYEEAMWWSISNSINFNIFPNSVSGLNNITVYEQLTNFSWLNASIYYYLVPNITSYNFGDIVSNTLDSINVTIKKPYSLLTIDNFSITFVYNNTIYPYSGILETTDNITLFYLFTSPKIVSTTIKTFYVNVSINGGTIYQDIINNQTIIGVSVINCSDGLTPLINVSIFNENDYTNLLTSNFEYISNVYFYGNNSNPFVVNGSQNAASSFSICFNTSGVNFTYDLYAKYTAIGGYTERIYLYNISNNPSSSINSGNFNQTTDQSILQLEVRNSQYFPLSNIVIHLERYYVSLDEWRIVQYEKSDENGIGLFYIREKDTDYRLSFYDTNNNFLKRTDNLKFFCTAGYCSLVQIIDAQQLIGPVNNLSINTFYNNITQVFTVSYKDNVNLTKSVRLVVTQEKSPYSIIICNTTAYGSVGTITCDTSGYSGTIGVRIYSSASPERPIFTYFFGKATQTFTSIMGTKEASFWGGFIVITMVAFGAVIGPVVSIAMAIFGLLALMWLGLASFLTTTMLIFVTIIGIYIGIKVRE